MGLKIAADLNFHCKFKLINRRGVAPYGIDVALAGLCIITNIPVIPRAMPGATGFGPCRAVPTSVFCKGTD